MKVLVVGGGGREHALCWRLSASPLCRELLCAPGNGGIGRVAECVPVAAEDLDGLVRLAQERAVDLVVVGPEAPLVGGLVDRLQDAGIRAFGPTALAAEIEGSKVFAKGLMQRYGIPTARWERFFDAAEAKAYAADLGPPLVVKADGLAAGKGVVVAQSLEEANAAIDAMLVARRFGEAGAEILIEECLTGREVSLFALTDGSHMLPLPSAHDYKRAQDGDEGPNTGGMGAVSPTPRLTPRLEAQLQEEVLAGAVQAMAAEGRPYTGVLYAGVILTEQGPKVLEFNCRFGDPECQALLARLDVDLLPALMACTDGTLGHIGLDWTGDSAVCVVMAAAGYPGAYETGTVIRGVPAAAAEPAVRIFHAGTAFQDETLVAEGGRVLGITGIGPSMAHAAASAYRAVAVINWPEGYCRKDIGRPD
ncbi:MAG: phosphoribosylamine--glycine ligase [Alphaproteobacteria bacterium]|jgi:phosphoribosylamine--glycine ligase|nr:phosphoribosylamine--glycine ligase [Alphaproteobacteria bacterium]